MAMTKVLKSQEIFPDALYGSRADRNAAATAASAKFVKRCVVSVSEQAPDSSAIARYPAAWRLTFRRVRPGSLPKSLGIIFFSGLCRQMASAIHSCS